MDVIGKILSSSSSNQKYLQTLNHTSSNTNFDTTASLVKQNIGRGTQCRFCGSYGNGVKKMHNSILGDVYRCTKKRTAQCINAEKVAERARSNSHKGSGSSRPLFEGYI
jgi:hypothetical protein